MVGGGYNHKDKENNLGFLCRLHRNQFHPSNLLLDHKEPVPQVGYQLGYDHNHRIQNDLLLRRFLHKILDIHPSNRLLVDKKYSQDLNLIQGYLLRGIVNLSGAA